MRTLITAAVLAFATLGTPTASASTPAAHDCGFVAQELVSGSPDTFTGVAYGSVLSYRLDEPVSIQCWLSVDGVRVAETRVGTGTAAATTHGEVTYTARRDQHVEMCTDWSAGAESGSDCPASTGPIFPPPEMYDLIDSVVRSIEEITCEVLRTAGVRDRVNATTAVTGIRVDEYDCDVWLLDPRSGGCWSRWVDFRPYDDPYDGPAC